VAAQPLGRLDPLAGDADSDAAAAEGRSELEALRCLKRRLADVVYRQLLRDAKQLAANSLPQGPLDKRLLPSMAQRASGARSAAHRRSPAGPRSEASPRHAPSTPPRLASATALRTRVRDRPR
jgi:transposase